MFTVLSIERAGEPHVYSKRVVLVTEMVPALAARLNVGSLSTAIFNALETVPLSKGWSGGSTLHQQTKDPQADQIKLTLGRLGSSCAMPLGEAGRFVRENSTSLVISIYFIYYWRMELRSILFWRCCNVVR